MPATVSATLAANEALARMRRSGTRVLPMAFGEAGLPVHPGLRDALAGAVDRNAYGPVAGCAELREAAAGYWQRRGIPADPGLVVCGPGSKPLLYGLVLAIGGDVAVPMPSWVSYAAQARLIGRRPLYVPTLPGEGGVPDPRLLAEAVTAARNDGRDVRSVVLTLPDNPTGTIARPETVARLCAVARELDLMIIADQIYRDLAFDTDAPFPCPARYAPERTVITTALSKSLALGGWRIGIAMLPDSTYGTELYGRLLGVVSEIWSSPSGPIQRAAAYAFGEPAELTERIAASRRLHAAVAGAMADRLTDAGAAVRAPRGAFYLYPDFDGVRGGLDRDHDVTTGTDLAGVLLRRYGVGVLAGSEFGEPAGALRLRLAVSLLYGDTDEQREESLTSAEPVRLPWIAGALDRAGEVFSALTAAAPEPGTRRTAMAAAAVPAEPGTAEPVPAGPVADPVAESAGDPVTSGHAAGEPAGATAAPEPAVA